MTGNNRSHFRAVMWPLRSQTCIWAVGVGMCVGMGVGVGVRDRQKRRPSLHLRMSGDVNNQSQTLTLEYTWWLLPNFLKFGFWLGPPFLLLWCLWWSSEANSSIQNGIMTPSGWYLRPFLPMVILSGVFRCLPQTSVVVTAMFYIDQLAVFISVRQEGEWSS